MTICMHLCRGNFAGAWIAEGGYEPIAELLFNEIGVDGYFLEYDSRTRAGASLRCGSCRREKSQCSDSSLPKAREWKPRTS